MNDPQFDPLTIPDYDEPSFWDKVKRHARSIGESAMTLAFTLYYALQDSDTPAWAKAVIVGALAYFVFPADAIPDFIPAAGYTDDIGALTAALGTIAAHLKPEHKTAAAEQVENLLGNNGDRSRF